MRKQLLSALIVPAVMLGVMVGPSAALADDGPVGHSGCFKNNASDTLQTYLEAENSTTKIRSSRQAVTVTANGTGKAFDCGPAGRARTTPKISVELKFRAEGKRLACSGTVGGEVSSGPKVTASVTCSGNREEMTVSLKYTCKNAKDCRISVTDETFSAASDGAITMLETRVIVTNDADVRTSSYVRLI